MASVMVDFVGHLVEEVIFLHGDVFSYFFLNFVHNGCKFK